MWDRLITDCHVATMDPAVPGPFGAIEDGAIAIEGGRIVRVGRRIELTGCQAKSIEPQGGAWITPGLVDCHTHLVFTGNRSDEFEARQQGATYADIAAAGGGIWSTVKAVRAASIEELVEQSRPRLEAMMRGGTTTIEIKSGYGLDPVNELKMLEAIDRLGREAAIRISPTLLALHALPPEYAERRGDYVDLIVDELVPLAAERGLARALDAYCERIAFTTDEIARLFDAGRAHGLGVKLHAEQLGNSGGAGLAARYQALSADHLEHVDEEGVRAMAAAGTVAVLLPGAFYALRETKLPPIDLLRRHKVSLAVASDCNPGTSPMLCPTLALNMACTLFGLTPEEALAGMTSEAARALALDRETGTIAAGKAADLAVWRVSRPADLCYWIGLAGPARRIFAGLDA